jgi:uncharacterized OB-fold protein
MPELPSGVERPGQPRPTPVRDPVSEPFWTAAAERRLVVQRCASCEAYQHPPGPICRRCSETTVQFAEVSGCGVLYSFTVSHQAFVPGFPEAPPYAIVMVELEEQAGLRMLGNARDVDPAALRVGMRMRVAFEEVAEGVVLPQFVPADHAEAKL